MDNNTTNLKHSLFSVFGIELEYMIVNRNTLDIMPIADQLIYKVAKEYTNDVEFSDIAWSNELALHLIELKTNGPTSTLHTVAENFHTHVSNINEILSIFDACLMPTGAHPWMDPDREAKLWPHGDRQIYNTYNKIFDCRGHGWSNLQSAHLNLPFANDEEFAKLHSAIRILLPLIPALTASTPIIENKLSGLLDTRLSFYGKNQKKVPSISGLLIPEVISTEAEYHQKILQPMYRDISPHDPEGILQHEWLNSRAAITRFDRDAIEIRILDTQECPLADVACMSFIVVILQTLLSEKWSKLNMQNELGSEQLRQIFDEVIATGQQATITNTAYLSLFGYTKKTSCSAKDLLVYLFEELALNITEQKYKQVIQTILQEGNLAERMLVNLGNDQTPKNIKKLYHQLVDCLQYNQMLTSDYSKNI